jgi:hypothetical protein
MRIALLRANAKMGTNISPIEGRIATINRPRCRESHGINACTEKCLLARIERNHVLSNDRKLVSNMLNRQGGLQNTFAERSEIERACLIAVATYDHIAAKEGDVALRHHPFTFSRIVSQLTQL